MFDRKLLTLHMCPQLRRSSGEIHGGEILLCVRVQTQIIYEGVIR